ncbi:hypothetical protein ACFVWG_24750 [Kribbella sp. NPDC058245]|uniref:hypothetical protein n=1 Tax=Kribbella sp. NPDC058245 TaxID=3346399 RepID=UPI0036ED74C8
MDLYRFEPASRTVTPLGPAVTGTPLTGATNDNTASRYVVTRGLAPCAVAEIESPGEPRVRRRVSLPNGHGGWGIVTSDAAVFVGTYPTAHVHRWDPLSGAVTTFGRLGEEEFVFPLAVGPGHRLYAGTYPGGKLFELDDATGTVRDLGQPLPTATYVRALAAAPESPLIHIGTGCPAGLLTVNPATSETQQLPIPELATEDFVYALAVTDDLIALGTEPGGLLIVIDRQTPQNQQVAETHERTIDTIAIDGHIVWCTARPSGSLFRYDTATGQLDRVGTPLPGQETRSLTVDTDGVSGISGGGQFWRWSGQSATVLDLGQQGLPAHVEPPQSLCTLENEILVGGNFGLCIHRPTERTMRRFVVDGEPKAMISTGDAAYLALYPGAGICRYDPETQQITRVGKIGGLSNRPRDIAWSPDHGLVLVVTRNQYGHRGGALAVVTTATGAIQRYDDLLGDNALSSLALDPSDAGTVIIGSETIADGLPLRSENAMIAEFDLVERRLLWTWQPLDEVTQYTSLAWHRNLLYGVTRDGRLFAATPETRRLVALGHVDATEPGRLLSTGDRLYLATEDAVLLIEPDLETSTILTGLASEWHNSPQLAADPSTGDLYVCGAGPKAG